MPERETGTFFCVFCVFSAKSLRVIDRHIKLVT